MAHELDFKANGVAAMFSVIETPWHNEGEILAQAPTLEEGMRIGGIDYEVDLRPLSFSYEVREGETVDKPITGHRAVVRTDRMETLGIVGPDYHVLQNREAFGVLEPLLDAGIASLETGGSLRGGIDPWMMVRFNITDPMVRDAFRDEVVPFGLISNNHNGTRKVILKLTPIRVVCANTLGVALRNGASDAVGVPHKSNVKSKTVEAAMTLFAGFTARYRVVAEQYETLRQARLTAEQFEAAVLDVLAPLPKAPEGEQKSKVALSGYERAKATADERRTRLIFLRDGGIGHQGDGSAWEAYQAVTQSLDHDVDLWKVKGESRVAALFDGTLGRNKQKALEAIYSVALAG